MGIIEQAAKRLEELRRGGVDIPWEASGLSEERLDTLIGKQTAPREATTPTPAEGPVHMSSLLVAAVQRREAEVPMRPPDAPVTVKPPAPARHSASVEIDLDALGRAGYLVPSMVRSNLALEFRHIKRPLLRHAATRDEPGDRNALIMVTSALAGEGKTFCAVNLAMSMAMEVDTSVLLVDADVIRPAVLERLGLPPSRGLMDVLTDPTLDLADVMLRAANVPKLSVLPAGSPNAMATELLASAAMDRLLVDLATRYPDRVIILDAPPLLLSTEARVLASRVGQVVMVVDSSRTTTSRVTEAFAAVEACPNVFSVLNKTADTQRADAYEYGYGHP